MCRKATAKRSKVIESYSSSYRGIRALGVVVLRSLSESPWLSVRGVGALVENSPGERGNEVRADRESVVGEVTLRVAFAELVTEREI
jgi:hypothetical protein